MKKIIIMLSAVFVLAVSASAQIYPSPDPMTLGPLNTDILKEKINSSANGLAFTNTLNATEVSVFVTALLTDKYAFSEEEKAFLAVIRNIAESSEAKTPQLIINVFKNGKSQLAFYAEHKGKLLSEKRDFAFSIINPPCKEEGVCSKLGQAFEKAFARIGKVLTEGLIKFSDAAPYDK